MRSSDFRKVYDQGTRYTCSVFAAFRLAGPDGPRVGFTTPKALGKSVVRNRIKRRMREAVRLELRSLSQAWFIVFNPRRKALDCPFSELQSEVRRFFTKCNESPSPSSSSSSAATNA